MKYIFYTTKLQFKSHLVIMTVLGIEVISTRETKKMENYSHEIIYEATDEQRSHFMEKVNE